mmetsp:Transcript_26707/g.50186  ORF Transcript_26707/g.50186 Transcript_26707/m.50186 type:complete len:236 (+) Transcript_26707:122-829(+)
MPFFADSTELREDQPQAFVCPVCQVFLLLSPESFTKKESLLPSGALISAFNVTSCFFVQSILNVMVPSQLLPWQLVLGSPGRATKPSFFLKLPSMASASTAPISLERCPRSNLQVPWPFRILNFRTLMASSRPSTSRTFRPLSAFNVGDVFLDQAQELVCPVCQVFLSSPPDKRTKKESEFPSGPMISASKFTSVASEQSSLNCIIPSHESPSHGVFVAPGRRTKLGFFTKLPVM